MFVYSKPFDFKQLLEDNYIDNCSLIRTGKIGLLRYDMNLNRKFMEDYDFLLRLIIEKQAKPFYAQTMKLNYRVLADSISRKENHTTREYFYDVYLYILKKHTNTHADSVFSAIEDHLLRLENRLANLTSHHREVSETMQQALNVQIEEKEAILNSTSYQLGNKIVRVIRGVKMVVQNPRLLGKVFKKAGRVLLQQLRKFPNPKKIALQPLRAKQREINNYSNPKRCLIFVIYENQPRLQRYKLTFLEALKEQSDSVYIIVNGLLNQLDVERLKKFGEVIIRENEGYDTAAFRHGIVSLGKEGLSSFDELLLVNDTNIGPFTDLAGIFDRMAERKLDFWGISYGEAQADITGINDRLVVI